MSIEYLWLFYSLLHFQVLLFPSYKPCTSIWLTSRYLTVYCYSEWDLKNHISNLLFLVSVTYWFLQSDFETSQLSKLILVVFLCMCWLVSVRISRTMPNRSHEKRHPYLFLFFSLYSGCFYCFTTNYNSCCEIRKFPSILCCQELYHKLR